MSKLKTFGLLVSLLVGTVAVLLSGRADAATCGPFVTGDGYITLTSTPDPSNCFAHGSPPPNINGNASDPVVVAGYSFLNGVTYGDGVTGVHTSGALSVDQTSTGVGTFSIGSVSGYYNFVIALKDGSLGSFQWVAFLLPAGATLGSWSLLGANGEYHGLSDFNLYAQSCPSTGCPSSIGPPVPIPAAAWLFGSALAGVAGLGRWRNKRARSAG